MTVEIKSLDGREDCEQTLWLVIAAVWFAIVLSDRIHIWLSAHHRRREIRREVQHYAKAPL